MLVLDGVEMLGVREAAALARRTPETIRRWIWSGKLSARRNGNRLFVAKDDIERLVVVASATDAPRSLRAWATEVAASRAGRSGVSAADLILDDRRERNGDAGR